MGQVATFMFFAALLQEFSFEIPTELVPPSDEKLRGQARGPAPYVVRVVPRHVRNLEILT